MSTAISGQTTSPPVGEAFGHERQGLAAPVVEAESSASDETIKAPVQGDSGSVPPDAPRHPKKWHFPYFSPKSGLCFPSSSLHPAHRTPQPRSLQPAPQQSTTPVEKRPFLRSRYQSGLDDKRRLRHNFPVLSHEAFLGILKRKQFPWGVSQTPYKDQYEAHVLVNIVFTDVSPNSEDRGPEYSIFVGDLGPEVNEYVLVSLFQARFPSCKSAKIMTDAMSGQSRGYGFVRFSDETDQQRALMEMQGVYCGNRPMRVSTATPKNRYVITRPPERPLFFTLLAII